MPRNRYGDVLGHQRRGASARRRSRPVRDTINVGLTWPACTSPSTGRGGRGGDRPAARPSPSRRGRERRTAVSGGGPPSPAGCGCSRQDRSRGQWPAYARRSRTGRYRSRVRRRSRHPPASAGSGRSDSGRACTECRRAGQGFRSGRAIGTSEPPFPLGVLRQRHAPADTPPNTGKKGETVDKSDRRVTMTERSVPPLRVRRLRCRACGRRRRRRRPCGACSSTSKRRFWSC